MIMKRLLLAIVFVIISWPIAFGQTLAFNIDAPPNLEVSVYSDGILDFGSLIQNQGTVQIPLEDTNTEIISITGTHNKTVHVTITPPPALQLDASNSLPFTLRAAYANNGEENRSQAELFNDNTATFRIYKHEGGPPPHTGNNQSNGSPEATAYLYIYGDIEVGPVRAGSYSGILNISVQYD